MLKKYLTLVNLSNSKKKLVYEFNNNLSIKYEEIHNCEICSFSTFKILFKNDRYGIRQITCSCENCGFIFSNPRMNNESRNLFYESDLYREIYENEESKEIYFSKIIEELKAYVPLLPKKPVFDKYYSQLYFDFINDEISDYDDVLDIGCGIGKKIIDFSNIGKNVTGIEPSSLYKKIHAIYKLNTSQGFITDIKKKYDLVILSHVLEHLNDLNEIINKLSLITKKYLFIEVPGHISKIQSIQSVHNYYFSINTLNYFITNNNFELINLEYAKDNEFIFALYRKIDNKNKFNFDKKKELHLVDGIYKNYIFKYILIRIIQLLGLYKFIKKNFNK